MTLVRKRSGGTHTVGAVLLAAGVLLAGAAICVAVLALTSPQSVPVITFLRDRLGGGHTIVNAVVGVQSVRIQGSDALATVLSLSVCGTLLLVLASVARALISAGSQLMRPGRADVDAVERDVGEITQRALERVAVAEPAGSLPRRA